MSVELVKAEIARFLADPESTVLCLRGKWGVGKTHTWNEQVKAALQAGALSGTVYAYVSHFGLNSLDQLKFALFEHSQKLDRTLKPSGFDTLNELIDSLPYARKALKAATSGSFFSRFISAEAAQALAFSMVRDQLICLDDLERRGEGLRPKDVLGLVSFLREHRNCKVAVILNDEGLDERSRTEFETHLEKVVDVSLVYEPSPTMAASIGVDSEGNAERQVAENCAALGITNIRTIQRTARLVKTIKPKLADYDPDVLRNAIKSLALFCWCRDDPSEAPPLDFIASQTRATWGLHTVKPATDEAGPVPKWRAMLRAYDYMWTDEFDLILMDGVKKGYFDDDRLAAEARKESAKFAKGRAEGSFEDAWRRLQDSFADDENEVLDGVYHAFLKNIEFITPINLSGTVELFKMLNRAEQASTMINQFIEARREESGLFDLAKDPFIGQYEYVAEVRTAFEKVAAESRETPDFVTLLAGANEDWSSERIEALAAAPVEEYHKAFKSHSGKELRQLLSNALHFANVGGVTDNMRKMTAKAQEALQVIAKESRLNALRVNRLGIAGKQIGDPPQDEASKSNILSSEA